jgi:hypothetical protein
MFEILFLIMILLGCSSKNNNSQTSNISIDSTGFSLIEKVLTKSTHTYEDYEAIFSGAQPVAFLVLDDFTANPEAMNTLKMLELEKLYRAAEELSNAKTDTKEAKAQVGKILCWPIFIPGSDVNKKWHKGIEEVYKAIKK